MEVVVEVFVCQDCIFMRIICFCKVDVNFLVEKK